MLGRRSSRASDGVSVRAETESGEGGGKKRLTAVVVVVVVVRLRM